MKIFLLIFLAALTFEANAQPNYVSTYLENQSTDALHLDVLPWDETRLFQYRRILGSSDWIYSIDEVAFGTLSPVVIPLCTEIQQVPQILDDGLLIVGATASGNELIYYDETNSTIFDLNLGSGDSDPVITVLEDRIFVIAFDGTQKQLFEFDRTTHSITQITTSTVPVESVCAIWDNKIYYRTKSENGAMNLDEYNLMIAAFNGSSFSHQIIYAIGIPSTPDRIVDWRSPQLFQGNLYLTGVNIALNGSATASYTHGIIIVDVNDQISTSALALPTTDGEFKMTQWDGKLGVYSDLHDQFYWSNDGFNFQSEGVPVNGRLVESHVSENDKLYFTCLYFDDTREIFEYENGFQSKFVGEHLHFLSQQENILYYTDYIQTDSSSIVLVYDDMNVVDEVKVHFVFHPPLGKTSVLFNDLFTFLFGEDGGFANMYDIFQLTGSPTASIDEVTIDARIFPNPVPSGSVITLETNVSGVGQLCTLDGKHIQTIEINAGANAINTTSLSRGVYILSVQNHTQRIVVN